MLFSDSNIAHPRHLLEIDGEVGGATTASSKERGSAQIDLDSLCGQAWTECRGKLEAALATFSTYIGTSGMQAHLSAVLNTGAPWGSFGTRARIRLSQIVVSETFYSNSLSPLERWVNYVALRLAYQELSNRFAGNDKQDRYEAKRIRYEKQEARLWSQILSQGIPFVSAFLDAPGSIHGYQSGTWDGDNLTTVADVSNTAVGGNFKVAITYVDTTQYLSPTNKNNGESAPSQILSFNVPANYFLSVNISSLNPSNPASQASMGLSQGVAPQLTAYAWNLYCGSDNPGSLLYLLNSTPIPIGTTTHSLIADPVLSGYTLTNGQVPDASGNLLISNTITRG